MIKFIRWSIINGSIAALAYCGFVEGVQGAANVALVILWLEICISPFVFTEKITAMLQSKQQWKKHVATTYDIAMCFFLLWIGMMWTGVFYLIHSILIASVMYSEKK